MSEVMAFTNIFNIARNSKKQIIASFSYHYRRPGGRKFECYVTCTWGFETEYTL